MTRTSRRPIWLVPSNEVSNFHHGQPQTLVDNGGHHARGQACDGPGSLVRYLGSGRRGHRARHAPNRSAGHGVHGSLNEQSRCLLTCGGTGQGVPVALIPKLMARMPNSAS